MSRGGAPDLRVRAEGLRVAVVAALWHEQVMTGLVEGALRALADAVLVGGALVDGVPHA